MNINFTSKEQAYINELVESGDYQNASEAVRDAVRLHQVYREKMIRELRAEIDKGWESPPSSKTMGDIIRSRENKHE